MERLLRVFRVAQYTSKLTVRSGQFVFSIFQTGSVVRVRLVLSSVIRQIC